MTNKIIIYTDGGSRGNPGPSAIGVVINNKKYSKYLGIATNNQAEYNAIIFALEIAKKQGFSNHNVQINLDSELVCKQLNGEYKVKNKKIQPLFLKAWNLMREFKNIKIQHIPREQNTQADKLVNQSLDKHITM